MEALKSLLLVSTTSILLIFAWKLLDWAWIKPKKMEKILREKGFKGKSFRLLIGDLKEVKSLVKEAKSKPMNFNNDIIPRVLPFYHKLVQDYGKNCFTWTGPRATVLIHEPDQIMEILAKSYVYQKEPSTAIGRLFAQGLATYDKDKWAKHRRLINPAFNLEKLKLMLPAFHVSCFEMLSKWNTIASAQQGPFELDVLPYIQAFTCDALSRTAFGSNYEEGKRIFELQKELAEEIIKMISNVYIPGMMYLPTKTNRKMKAIAKDVRSSILSIVNRRSKAIQAGKDASGNDLLGVLLESNSNEIREKGSRKSGMSFEDVVEECKLFYFAGQETTGTLLVWTLILLAKHSGWQARARDEVCQIFGKTEPAYEELCRLKVMTMIFNEVLRLYPPVVMFSRMIHEDTILGDQTLPAGIHIILPTIMLHHDENIWGSDAKEFKPERFSEGVLNATKGQLVFFPFGSGPRVCIGQNFAMLEAKMALSLILQSFSLELSPLYAHAPHTMITLQPQHGAQLVLHKL